MKAKNAMMVIKLMVMDVVIFVNWKVDAMEFMHIAEIE